jgi:hypothetical protein
MAATTTVNANANAAKNAGGGVRRREFAPLWAGLSKCPRSLHDLDCGESGLMAWKVTSQLYRLRGMSKEAR